MSAVRVGLVGNTRSGAGDRVAEVERALREAGAEVETIPLTSFCEGPDAVDEERLASTAAKLRSGTHDRVVVAGGDGSLGPGALLALRAGVPMAVVPIGTANSFARFLDLPLDLAEAVALAAYPHASTRPAELADADGRPFVNVAATGLSVDAAHLARPFKKALGPLAYAVGAARAGFAGDPLSLSVVCDGEVAWSGKAWQVLVAATGAFGGESATGGVDPEDHRLDVAIVEAGPRIALVRRAWGMRMSRLVEQDEVPHVRGRVVELDLDGHDPSFNVDGEVLRIDPPRFSILGQVEVVTG